MTHLLAVDVTSKKGIRLLHEGLRYLVSLYNQDVIFFYVLDISNHYLLIFIILVFTTIIKMIDFYVMMQMEGSKGGRVGMLFSGYQDADVSRLLFVKAFEITASSYRFI